MYPDYDCNENGKKTCKVSFNLILFYNLNNFRVN